MIIPLPLLIPLLQENQWFTITLNCRSSEKPAPISGQSTRVPYRPENPAAAAVDRLTARYIFSGPTASFFRSEVFVLYTLNKEPFIKKLSSRRAPDQKEQP